MPNRFNFTAHRSPLTKLWVVLIMILPCLSAAAQSSCSDPFCDAPQTCPHHATVDLCIMMDEAFVAQYGSVALAREKAKQIFDTGLGQFATWLNYITFIDIEFRRVYFTPDVAPDSWFDTDYNEWAERIRSYWSPGKSCIKRDGIIFFTGRTGMGYNGVKVGNDLCEVDGSGSSQSTIMIVGTATNEYETIAHEVGHLLGLPHEEFFSSCASLCNISPVPLMCISVGRINTITTCDVSCLGYLFCEEKCECLQEASLLYPDDFACPPPTDPASFLVTADNPNPVFDCKTGGDIVEFTVTLFNDNTTTNRNIRAFINNNHGTHAEFVQDANLAFNCIQTVSGGTEFWITNGNDNPGTPQCEDEKVFAMGPMGEQTVKFKVRYTGFDPVYGADFTVKVYSGASTQSSISKDFTVLPYIEINGGKYSNLYTSINNQWDINSPLYIKGDLEMDISPLSGGDQYNFSLNKKLLFAEGKGLLINNVKTTMIGVEVGGCDNMWKGITVKSGKVFETDMMTSIADAQWAVSAQKGATVTLKNTKFINNNFAVRTDPTGSGAYNLTLKSNEYRTDGDGLKPAYSGQSPAPLGKGFAGLYLKDAGSVVIDADPASGSTNQFSNLKYGILAENTNVVVHNTAFQDITKVSPGSGYSSYTTAPTGKGIYAKKGYVFVAKDGAQEVTFNNCHTSVEALDASSQVAFTNMTDVTNGIVTTGGASQLLLNNTINAKSRGISTRFPSGFGTASVGGNVITMNGASNGLGISTGGGNAVTINGNGVPQTKGNYTANTITMLDGATGLDIGVTLRCNFASNTINLPNSGANRFGIRMEGGDGNTLKCNPITGQGGNQTGIYAIHPDRAKILCNTADGTNQGLHFQGVMVGKAKADIAGNTMKDNETGLLYGIDAITGGQVHRGNIWDGSFGSAGAEHQGGLIVAIQSKYTVDEIENPDFFPGLSVPFGWFQDVYEEDKSYECSAEGGNCITVEELVPDAPLDIKIVRGELPGSEYQAAVNWLAQRRFYERILEEGNPYPGNSDVAAFQTAAQTNGLAAYASLQTSIRQMFAIGATDDDNLQSYEEQIADGLEDLADVEDQLHTPGISQQDSANLVSQRTSIQQTIEQAAAAKETLLNNTFSARATSAGTLLTQNSNLPNLAVPYTANEKTVNDILLRTVAQGVYTFSEPDYDTLEYVANLCPLSDGEAVLLARALLTLVDEEPVVYDDVAICDTERGRPGAIVKSEFLRVYPNPASNQVTIDYNIAQSSESLFQLFNNSGQTVKTIVLSESRGSIQLPLQDLPEGVYWYTLPGINNIATSGKVIISH